MKARTGEKVWGFHASERGLNSAPVVDGYRVYITHSEENVADIDSSSKMGRVICIDGRGQGDVTKTHEAVAGRRRRRRLRLAAAARRPALRDDQQRRPVLLRLRERHEALGIRRRAEGKGSPVWADGKIYVTLANGQFKILEDKGDSCQAIDAYNFNAGPEKGIEIFSSPAVSDGRIAFCTTTEMICFGKPDAKPQPVAAEKLPDEAAVQKEPATLLVRPAEVLLKPARR